jgi:uroporphyrinogen-III synthase
VVQKELERAAVWLFTSKRTVFFMKPLLTQFSNKTRPEIYVVGEKTALALRNLGYSPQIAAGNASELLPHLLEIRNQPTAFFCNTDRMDFFPEAYSGNTNFSEVPIYEGFELPLPKTQPKTDYIIALSPKTMQTLYAADEKLKQVAVISIGKTTTAWLLANGVVPQATCEQPSVENCLIELKKQNTHATKE